VFHLSLCFIAFGGRSAHLACHVHKSDRKTPIINHGDIGGIIWGIRNNIIPDSDCFYEING